MKETTARPATLGKPSLLLLVALLASSLAAPLSATELPKRKPGLWELKTKMEGMPSIGAIQQCIDRNSDDLLMQQAEKENHKCSVLDVKINGNKASVHAVCQVDGSTATTDASFVGSFDTAYKGTVLTRFSPPMEGISESRMTLDARWTGPCKAGQKAGDVVLPGMGGMNVNEMMNDPRVKEMLNDPRLQEMMKQKQ